MKNVRGKLEVPMPAAMPCKIKREKYRETCRVEKDCKTKYAFIVEAGESTRKRMEGSLAKNQEDHHILFRLCLVWFMCVLSTRVSCVCVSLCVFKGLRVVLRCVCVVCLVRLFGFVSRVLFGDVNVEQQTSPFLPGAMLHCPRPGGYMTVFYQTHLMRSRTRFLFFMSFFVLGV